jgi:hypothetical protein
MVGAFFLDAAAGFKTAGTKRIAQAHDCQYHLCGAPSLTSFSVPLN